MTNEEISNRKLWDDIFDALQRHQNSHAQSNKQHAWRASALRIQMNTLFAINNILSNTYDACNRKEPEPEPHRVETWLGQTTRTDKPGIVITST